MQWLNDIKWDDQGLVPVIAQERGTGDVLMFDSEMVKRKALTDDDDVRAMGEAVLTDFRRALEAREKRR